ncbi:MAG: hypothetical protein SGPRY_012609, partial [Prymnesium sp.]
MSSHCSAATADSTPRLAVLGIFSAEDHHVLRKTIRSTWLFDIRADADILPRFVIRGIGLSKETTQESEEYHDTVMLAARSSLNRRAGPLASLLLWFGCVVKVWPHAQLVGKADDDIWSDLTGTAALLRGSLEATRVALDLESVAQVQLYWGMMETFSWEVDSQRPVGFAYKWGRSGEACALKHYRFSMRRRRPSDKLVEMPYVAEIHTAAQAQNASIPQTSNKSLTHLGPFHFAKGPMFYLSSSLAVDLLNSASVQHNWNATMATTKTSNVKGIRPWEDVWTGFALA